MIISGKKIYTYRQEIYWGDQDSFGHVNNVSTVRYFENARADFFTKSKLWDPGEKFIKEGMLLTDLQIEYRKQIQYPGTLLIDLILGDLSSRKFVLFCEMKKDDVTCIKGRAELIWYNFETQKLKMIPEILTLLKSN